MKIARILLLALMAVALGGALAACSSSDDKSTATATKAAAGSPTVTKAGASPTATAAGQTIQVTAKEFSFAPAAIDVTKGQPATFKVSNKGSASHTFTVYTDPTFTARLPGADTGTIPGGKNGEFTVTIVDKGVYPFQCTIHTVQMRGVITVK